MPRRTNAAPPSDDEIMAYLNVPYAVAAKYIGWSDVSLRYALQEQRAPFGMAAQNPETGTWSYNIMPAALIKYRHGELEYYRLNDLIKIICEAIEREMSKRLGALTRLIDTILGRAA